MPGCNSWFNLLLALYFLVDTIFSNLDVDFVVVVNSFPQYPPSKLSIHPSACPSASDHVLNYISEIDMVCLFLLKY